MTLYGLFCDNGRTGTDFDRPQFEKMMEAVKRGEVDCIVVKDLSRFGRNYKETGNYLERIFPFLGVRFIAVNDGFDTLTARRGADGYLVPLKESHQRGLQQGYFQKVRLRAGGEAEKRRFYRGVGSLRLPQA